VQSYPAETAPSSEIEVSVDADLTLPVLVWDLNTDRVWCSQAFHQLYDRRPHDCTPSLALQLEHVHPADVERAERAFERIRRDGRPFVLEHRLVTQAQQIRTVILIVNATPGPSGRPETVVATSIDVTEARRIHHAASEETVSGLQAEISRLNAAAEARDVISHATGLLMERYKIPADDAAALLRKGSQIAGRKLLDVASELLFSGSFPDVEPLRSRAPKPGPVVRRQASR
jgi:ANTAR domain/PAS fold